jgi:hypothetical protein
MTSQSRCAGGNGRQDWRRSTGSWALDLNAAMHGSRYRQ